jgi:DNA-binding transcriptional MerR regulator
LDDVNVMTNKAGVYSIGAVARMLAIPAPTLRAWEDRYAQVVPGRSPGGQRLYTRAQVEQLRFVREQIDSGLQPADAHRLLAERLSQDVATGPDGPREFHAVVGEHREPGSLAILLAERDPYAADFADYFLRTEGYTVHLAFDAARAEHLLGAEPISVVVVDLLISGGAGLELCRSVRERHSIPILAVSPLDSSDDALEAGADAFLRKPIDPITIVSTVRDLLGTSAYLRSPGSAR